MLELLTIPVISIFLFGFGLAAFMVGIGSGGINPGAFMGGSFMLFAAALLYSGYWLHEVYLDNPELAELIMITGVLSLAEIILILVAWPPDPDYDEGDLCL